MTIRLCIPRRPQNWLAAVRAWWSRPSKVDAAWSDGFEAGIAFGRAQRDLVEALRDSYHSPSRRVVRARIRLH